MKKSRNLVLQKQIEEPPNPIDIDPSGLTKSQLRFLTERVKFHSDAKAARSIGLATGTPYIWKRSPAFKSAYDNVLRRVLDVSKALAEATLKETLPVATERLCQIAALEVLNDKGELTVPEKVLGNVIRADEAVLDYTGMGEGVKARRGVTIGVQLIFPPEVHADKWHKPVDADYKVIEVPNEADVSQEATGGEPDGH